MLLTRAAAIHESICRGEGRSLDTIRLYGLIHRYYLIFCRAHTTAEPTVEELNPLRVHEYLTSLRARQLSPRTIAHYARVLRAWSSALSRELSTSAHPWTDLLKEMRVPRVPQRIRAHLEPAEFDALVSACIWTELPNRNLALLFLMGDSGLRVSEVCRAEWANLVFFKRAEVLRPDAAHGTLKVVMKGNVERVLPFGKRTHDALRHYMDPRNDERPADSPYLTVFLARDGTPLSTDAVRFLLHTLQAKAGITQRVHPHLIRASYATWQYRAGVDVETIRRLMGHSALGQTLEYVDPEENVATLYSSPLDRRGGRVSRDRSEPSAYSLLANKRGRGRR